MCVKGREGELTVLPLEGFELNGRLACSVSLLKLFNPPLSARLFCPALSPPLLSPLRLALPRLDTTTTTARADGETIAVDGTMRLCADIGIADPEDVVLLAVAYELKSPAMGQWSRKGWTDGWRHLG